MNFGFNSNVRVGNALYHVQTEDRGPTHPFLDTVVYMSGRVVYKRSIGYDLFAISENADGLAEKLHERLAVQHREVIAELEAGTLPIPGKERTPAAGNPETLPGFELRLMNPKNWLAAGTAILEIEVCDRISKQRVGGADVESFMELEKNRIPCAEGRTNTKGSITLRFLMPPDVSEQMCLVVRATDGEREGELRFNLKARPRQKSPAPVSQ
ncbi:MAG TPA: hypothetical protein VGI34_03505 [Candidatus Acidoferrales bacterium]